MMIFPLSLIFLCGLAAALQKTVTLQQVIEPVGQISSSLERECLMRYGSTITTLDNQKCYDACMKGSTTNNDCIDLNMGAFGSNVVYPCFTHYIPFFDQKRLSQMVEGVEIIRLDVHSPPQCQAECQKQQGCTQLLYYNPVNSKHPKNCELLINYQAPAHPSGVHPNDVNTMQCITCSGYSNDGAQNYCGRYHPYVLASKPQCKVLNSIYGRTFDNSAHGRCRVAQPPHAQVVEQQWVGDADFLSPAATMEEYNRPPTTTTTTTTTTTKTAKLKRIVVTKSESEKTEQQFPQNDDESDDYDCQGPTRG